MESETCSSSCVSVVILREEDKNIKRKNRFYRLVEWQLTQAAIEINFCSKAALLDLGMNGDVWQVKRREIGVNDDRNIHCTNFRIQTCLIEAHTRGGPEGWLLYWDTKNFLPLEV